MKVSISSKNNGAANPQNMEHLPDWIDVEVVERNDVFYLSEVIVNRPLTFDLLDELWDLQVNSEISLRNSNRIIAGESLIMCKHLHLIYQTAYKAVEKLLSEATYELSNKRFRLCDGGYTLEYTGGKRALYSLSDTPADKVCLDKWVDGSYQTIHWIANTLKRMAEQSLTNEKSTRPMPKHALNDTQDLDGLRCERKQRITALREKYPECRCSFWIVNDSYLERDSSKCPIEHQH